MKHVTALLTILIVLCVTQLGLAQSLQKATPASVGMSAERLDKIGAILKDDTSKGNMIPGAVLLVARHGKIAYFDSFGILDPATKAPMTKDAIFRIFSMSKAITTVTAMTLVEEGKMSIADQVSRYIPSFRSLKVAVDKPDKTVELVNARPMTVQDLMRHTSGLTYGFFGAGTVKKMYNDAGVMAGDYDNAEFVERLAKLPLGFQPGTTWDYSHSTDVLGRVVEIVSGKSLYEAEKERILTPLGMTDTSFYVTDKSKHPRIAEPYPNDRTIGVGATFGDPRVAMKSESGGGGMMSTAIDYAHFLQMMLSGGALDGKRILSPKTVGYMTSDHTSDGIVPGPYYLPGAGYGFGLGFAVRRTTGVNPEIGTKGDYTWNGVGGTYFFVDPEDDMFTVFMIQSTRQRPRYMTLIRNMVYAAVEK